MWWLAQASWPYGVFPTPWPVPIVVNAGSDPPNWTYTVQYFVQALAAAGTIYAAYVAVGGAYRAATREAEGQLRAQRQANHAERKRLRDELENRRRAIRTQLAGMLAIVAHILLREVEVPDASLEDNVRKREVIVRFLGRVYEMDVADALDDEQLEVLLLAARWMELNLQVLESSWANARPVNLPSISRNVALTLRQICKTLAVLGRDKLAKLFEKQADRILARYPNATDGEQETALKA